MENSAGEAAPASGITPSEKLDFVRPGLTAITPYIVIRGASELKFLKLAFDGIEQLRVPRPDGSIMHAEVGIGNGAIELADANQSFPSSPMDVHLYVGDCDATYEHALRAGATSIYAPADQPWGDRWSAVKDTFGNHWYIATAHWTPGPEGIPSVQPYLHLRGADKMLPFLQHAFGARDLGVKLSPNGHFLHATIGIGNATLEVDEAQGDFQPKPCHLHVYVPDTDAAYERAMQAGGTSIQEPSDEQYGDRSASVKDAFGNSWFIATYQGAKQGAR